ncbi:hypothetical protein B0T26DRAFT_746787 [Lasiosphaeria miniovina]|uniref:Uncharacterized protein n=1 Tax=Lasiosphaeria miniovina TaxID=1954250 RepID=A0AA40EB01_9PEZI|nr:uncharacterized protein B0T26DRAFT_746787 [Lasiosphaeria miniovina]KAK0734944.1 hypothetical protein B0T26DRAFT_746787 [Lasiosphaeria miniovina]
MLSRPAFNIRRLIPHQRRPSDAAEVIDEDSSFFYHDDEIDGAFKGASRIKSWRPPRGFRRGSKPSIDLRRTEDIHRVVCIPPMPDTPQSSTSSLCSCEHGTDHVSPRSSPPRRPGGNRSPQRSPLLCPEQLEHPQRTRGRSPPVSPRNFRDNAPLSPPATPSPVPRNHDDFALDPVGPLPGSVSVSVSPTLESDNEPPSPRLMAAEGQPPPAKSARRGSRVYSEDAQKLMSQADEAFKLGHTLAEARLPSPVLAKFPKLEPPAHPVRRKSQRSSQSSVKSPTKSPLKSPLLPTPTRLPSAARTKRTKSKKSKRRPRAPPTRQSSMWTLTESAKDLFTIRIFHRLEADEMLPESTLRKIRMSRACQSQYGKSIEAGETIVETGTATTPVESSHVEDSEAVTTDVPAALGEPEVLVSRQGGIDRDASTTPRPEQQQWQSQTQPQQQQHQQQQRQSQSQLQIQTQQQPQSYEYRKEQSQGQDQGQGQGQVEQFEHESQDVLSHQHQEQASQQARQEQDEDEQQQQQQQQQQSQQDWSVASDEDDEDAAAALPIMMITPDKPPPAKAKSTAASSPPMKMHRRLPSRQLPPLPTIPEVIATGPENAVLSPTSVPPPPWGSTSKINKDDFVFYSSTPFTFNMPTFRHGDIRLAKADMPMGKLAVDDTLDWTAFQMAILGGANDFFSEPTDYSRPSDAELDERDDLVGWFAGFGFESPGGLLLEAAVAAAAAATSESRTPKLTPHSGRDDSPSSTPNSSPRSHPGGGRSPGMLAVRRVDPPPSSHDGPDGEHFGPERLGDSIASRFSLSQEHHHQPQHRRAMSDGTNANTNPVAAAVGNGVWRDRDHRPPPSSRRHVGLAIDSSRRPSVDSMQSLPQSPMLDLVVSKDVDGNEYVVPMGFNLGHDLGDFLKWEAEHVFAAGYYGPDES